jgi:hypothetical protein
MSLRGGGVLDVYLYFVFSPPVRGFPAYLYTCTCIYMWPLAPMKYNLSIPNSENFKNSVFVLDQTKCLG